MKPTRPVALAALLIILTVPAVPAFAAGPETDDENAPSTAVARLKIVKGTAWVRPADSGEWEEYPNNSPVAERARVSVPQGSEAELQFRGSQFLLLQERSEVDVRQLGEQKVSFRLRAGQVAFSLSKEDFAPVSVKVPGNRDAVLDAPGLYWLTVDGGTATLSVRRGEGTVSGEGTQPVAVKAGEEASIGKEIRVSRTGSAAAQTAPEPALSEAEQKSGVPASAATELREYGEWVSTPEYGYVWRPYVSDGWAPYYYGRWTWVYPYGWNWVGYEPWGWWPYHFGWWVSYPAFGWVWCPYNSFYSSAYNYRGYSYPYRYGYYYPGNVRFVNDGRYIRWVPDRPGQTTTRTTFSRSDNRLARWNRSLPEGTLATRGAGGRPAATGGRGVAGVNATTGRAAGVPQTDGSGAGRGTAGRQAGQAALRPSPEGGGRVSAIPQGTGPPWRSYGGATSSRYSVPAATGRAPADRGGAWYRGRDGEFRGYGGGTIAPPARGYDTGPGGYVTSPRGSYGGGAGTGSPRSFEGTAPRGYDGGSRSFDGGWGSGGSGGGGRGSGGSWGGGSWGGGGRGGGGSGGGGRTR